MSERSVWIVLLAAAVSLAVIILFTGGRETRPAPRRASPATGAGSRDLNATDINGNLIRLSDLRGRICVVEFWATWCPPCREEVPNMVKLRQSYPEEDLSMIGVSLDESVDELRGFLSEHGITYPQICDEKGFDGEIVRAWEVNAIPQTYVLDAQGVVREDTAYGRRLLSSVAKLVEELRETRQR
ncbi:MAG: TlpA disulfide reductase family protein [Planctomycetota bacterium]